MYKFSYAEILDDDCNEARQRERMALDRAVELLGRAEAAGAGSSQALEALRYVQKLWAFLIECLADPANELGEALRADLISIGLWVIREADGILAGGGRGFGPLIEINKTIRDGLR